ncbi:DNA repair protein RAD50-like [Asterias amurensis]|uniref:DNA repair protein RAD50-like n=1 Tax=Asterias amurensis TaxID=7602 RepID=UPI003AB89AC6
MSSIEKLSIRGIRSFGHEDRERQVIEFFHPLTLITGQNGAGKTTVIECLKYVCTGDMPPGAKGAAFIHDPKVAHETEIKAQVKLKFNDVTGKSVIITRNSVVTQKLKKAEFKSMEGVILRTNELGERVSLSSKCAELDREMVASLGVSKPVLTNVIFCHQEEACWPLSDGKSLKGKFDEIFAATRYIKALEVIRKLRSEQNTSIREFKTDVKYLKERKDKVKELSSELESKKKTLSAAKESVNHITKELHPLGTRIHEIEDREEEINLLSTEVAKRKAEKTQMDKNKQEIEDNLEFIFQGTNDELRTIFREHQAKIEEKERQYAQTEKKLSRLGTSLQQVNDKKSQLLLKQGELGTEHKQHLETIKNRDRRIQKVASDMQFAGFTGTVFSDEKVEEFIELMDEELKEIDAEGKELLAQYRSKEEGLETQLQEFRDTKTKLQHTVQMKSDMTTKNKDELKRINHQLSRVEASAHRLQELEEELKRAESELKEAESAMDLDKLRREVQKLQTEKQTHDAEMSQLSNEMSAISLQSKARAQLEILQKDKNAKEDQIRKIRGRHEEDVNRLLGHFPTDDIRNKLADYLMSRDAEVKNHLSAVQRIRGQLSTKEANRKMIMDELKKKEEELRGYEARLLQECGSQDVGATLEQYQQAITNLQSEKGALTGSSHLFERYIRSLQRAEAQCPLCHRGFDGQTEVDELVQELQDKLRMAPSKMTEKDQAIKQNRSKYDKLIELKPVKDFVTKLSETEIPGLRSKLTVINADIEKLKSSLNDEEDSLMLVQVDLSMANEMKPDIWQMDRCLAELKELEKRLAVQSQQLSGADAGRTIQQVNAERQDLEIKLDTVNRTLDHKQRQINQQSKTLQVLGTRINDTTGEKLRLSGELQQQEKLHSQKAELTSANQSYNREITDANKQLKPIESKLSKLMNDKEKLQREKEQKVEEHKSQYDLINQKKHDVKIYTKNIKSYEASGKEEKLIKVRSDITSIEDNMAELTRNQKDLTTTINQLNEDIANQQVRERELSDNTQLRKKVAEISKVEEELNKLKEQLGGIDQENMKGEKRQLQTRYTNLTKEKNQADGRQAVLKEEVKKAERELSSDMYSNADDKYNDMMIKLRTTEIANSDLDKYSKALDRAVMNYHHMKMSEINKIIRDLWRVTYKGQDIDYVEIRSDEETGGTQQRKNYNYRVVMVKGDTALDMRGRCSAGQKVLASLLIRLALAETFCLSCGILALDEPTTNLDKDNIESLAQALVEIIKSREQQRNFQLIVITHDEDFVELLGHSDYTDYFYRITKNHEFKSTVSRREIGTLQAVA